ncbi:hypothetical protein GE21DRAFT_1075996 [Neurospora crassa]|nr:hypothetical protein GE21DRAFT_1075996 [Neurospora crassa]
MDGTAGLYGAILGACAQNAGRAIWNSVSVGLDFGLCRSRSSLCWVARMALVITESCGGATGGGGMDGRQTAQ